MLKDLIAQDIGAKHGETKPCRVCCELADTIIKRVCEAVAKVPNPFEAGGEGTADMPLNIRLRMYEAYEIAKLDIIKAIRGER